MCVSLSLGAGGGDPGGIEGTSDRRQGTEEKALVFTWVYLEEGKLWRGIDAPQNDENVRTTSRRQAWHNGPLINA